MGQFFKFLFASCLGTILAGLVLSFVAFSMVGGLIASSEKTAPVSSNSVLEFKFDQPIPERTNNLEMNPFDIDNQYILGLQDYITSIERAKNDNDIKGIFLNLEFGGTGLATASALRDALVDFKESGKFIIAYSKYYTQGAYYLGSVADKVYINPVGNLDLHGLSAMTPFYKSMLDKVGVEMKVFYAGKFKSATEPFRRYEMSDESKLQLRAFLDPAFNDFLQDIATSRNKTVAELRGYADDLLIRTADDAVKYGLVDKVAYIDEIQAEMRELIGLEDEDKVPGINFADYHKATKPTLDLSIKNKIAVVYAEGAINMGEGDPGTTGDEKYVKILQKVRKDDKIKAIVLRVNSPGGSPVASENIWRELELSQAAGKKVVVSMGDYAASGGYYISCGADKIYAEENTLTGSIGVFMMIPNTHELMADKIGMTFDTVKTTRNSQGLNTYFDMSQAEKDFLNGNIQSTYALFKKRVAEGRGMTEAAVEEIAQGRVWSGEDGKRVGLVDELGGLNDAIAEAANLAGLEEYRTTEYPRVKEPLQQFIEELTGEDKAITHKILQQEMGSFYPHYKQVKQMMSMKGVQATLPVMVELK